MADLTAGTDTNVFDDTLGRLSKKAGVKATILLDRNTGAILKMDGQIATLRHRSHLDRIDCFDDCRSRILDDGIPGTDVPPVDETKGARELAALVWNFVRTSGDFVQAIDTEDELKLLRLRTKKQELVVVPDSKYLLIVVHDTPPA